MMLEVEPTITLELNNPEPTKTLEMISQEPNTNMATMKKNASNKKAKGVLTRTRTNKTNERTNTLDLAAPQPTTNTVTNEPNPPQKKSPSITSKKKQQSMKQAPTKKTPTKMKPTTKKPAKSSPKPITNCKILDLFLQLNESERVALLNPKSPGAFVQDVNSFECMSSIGLKNKPGLLVSKTNLVSS
jgi:hypothetical protein